MESNLYETLGQFSSTEAGQLFRDHLRGSVRQIICEVMAAEVDETCSRPSAGIPIAAMANCSLLKRMPSSIVQNYPACAAAGTEVIAIQWMACWLVFGSAKFGL